MPAQDACVFCDLDIDGRSAVKVLENRGPTRPRAEAAERGSSGAEIDLPGRALGVYPFLTFRSTAAHRVTEYFESV